MDLSDYITAVTAQMRCKRARAPVAKELAAHIEDQKRVYVEAGLDHTWAEAEAVRQMGDAKEVGRQLDRIHRPRMDVKTLTLVGIFSLSACFLQNMVVVAQSNGEIAAGRTAFTTLSVFLGVLLMTGILFVDYTWLEKRPLAVWIVLLLTAMVPVERIVGRECGAEIIQYLLLALFLPAYAGVICYYRKKRWLGLFLCLIWLAVGILVFYFCSGRFFSVMTIGLTGILLLVFCVVKGWFDISKHPALLALALMVGGGICVFSVYILKWRGGYQGARLEALWNGGWENSYIAEEMRRILQNLQMVGGSKISFPWEGASAFLLLMEKLGIAVAALAAAGLAMMFVLMAAGVRKQKNVFGGILGAACLLGLLLPTILHILCNFALIPYCEAVIPFLFPGWTANAVCYTLLGLYLSVYRNTDVAA